MARKAAKPKWTGSIVFAERYRRPSKTASAAQYVAQLRDSLIQDRTPAVALESRREQFARVLRPHVRCDKRGDFMLDLGDGWQRYTIMSDAPESVFDAAQGMDILCLLCQPKLRRSEAMQLAYKLGYLVQILEGVRAIEGLANKGWDITEARRCGGRATTKWTPAVEEQAKQIFANEKQPKVSHDAAYRRTAARLKAEHGIEVSKDTLKRHLSGSLAQR